MWIRAVGSGWGVVLALLALNLHAEGMKPSHAPVTKAAGPEVTLRRRTMEPAAAGTIQAVQVAPRVPVTMVFAQEVRVEGVVLADPHQDFFDPEVSAHLVRIVARRPPQTSPSATLNVPLTDGTVIPLVLVPAGNEADVQLEWKATAPPQSQSDCEARVSAAKAEAEALRASVDDQLPLALARRIAAAEEEGVAPTLEVRGLRHLDKVARVHIEVTRVYRVFEQTFLTLHLENRDPERPFSARTAHVSAVDGGATVELRVLAVAASFEALAPSEAGTVVVAFDGAFDASSARLDLVLEDASGARTLRLEGVQL